ncbi:MAG: hypothetical protein GXY67_00580 [Clostridiales bacterium]|nr:hypothetical protein [Clostridiales bacterium]
MIDQAESSQAQLIQYRSLLTKLPGVYAATVLPGEDEAVREIHIVASRARNPKQISRDVQSALLAAFDLQVDHRIISIAQLGENPFAASAPCPAEALPGFRLQCMGVQSGVEADNYHVSVHLRADDRDLVGEDSCRYTPSRRVHAIVQATLNAVHQFFNRDGIFSLVAAQATSVGSVPIAVTVLEYAGDHGEQLLIGAAHQEDDPAMGFVKSTLDALNRCLAKVVAED